jgi:lysophospholipase L1-like esterase
MKEYRPINVLFFLLFTCSLLLPIVYFAPDDGYEIFGKNLKFLTWENLITPKNQQKKNIDFLDDVDVSDINDESFNARLDSSKAELGLPSKSSVLAVASQTHLEQNDEAKVNLSTFFSTLRNITSRKEKISIFHYGDSQIEGDRMTAFIRQRLQSQFGGAGPGLIPSINVYSTISFGHNYSGNFKRKIIFGKEKLSSKKYGAMLSAAIFEIDSLAFKQKIPTEAWIELTPSTKGYSRCKAYTNVNLFYTDCIDTCAIEVFLNGELYSSDSLVNDGSPHKISFKFPTTPKKLRLVFKSKSSPTINGISLEGDVGIQMNNVAMRGSSGTQFTSLEKETFSFMHRSLKTGLVIMQFGGNSIPFFKDSSSVRSYARRFKRQIEFVKKCTDNAAIIVIGPSDMSQLQDGIYQTYPFIPYCIKQMKKETLNAGGSYWDLYNAMGGKDSMFAWVENNLAGKDYVHFTTKGSKKASQLFYDAFIDAYNNWAENLKVETVEEINE